MEPRSTPRSLAAARLERRRGGDGAAPVSLAAREARSAVTSARRAWTSVRTAASVASAFMSTTLHESLTLYARSPSLLASLVLPSPWAPPGRGRSVRVGGSPTFHGVPQLRMVGHVALAEPSRISSGMASALHGHFRRCGWGSVYSRAFSRIR